MILITGARGVVGSAICKRLVESGVEFIPISHSVISDTFVHLDLLSHKDVEAFFKRNSIDIIIHCAALIPSKSENCELDIYKKNQEMLINILSNVSNRTCFVNIGSTAIYNLGNSNTLTELSEISCATFYQLSKYHGEQLLAQFYADTTNLLNLRISSPYSTYSESDSILFFFIKQAVTKSKIEIWGSGERKQAFTNVETFSKDLLHLINIRQYGTYNYVTTPGISMKELALLIKDSIPSLEVFFNTKNDPEDNCRTSIDASKIQDSIPIKDTIRSDVHKIIRMCKK